ncbi:hypothetical protein PMI22_05698 [Pseudomonas sp. GM21]|jgi:hypothetical protein|nr:hypothetical protein PMI22_05698 [Pseudomonas sp. GM21]MDR6924848.1 hypothetical protein [Pseudomonas sp. BE134]MDR7283935.1 hypothetical protein [Pseudomonas corrugata]
MDALRPLQLGTRSVPGCVPTQSVGTIKLNHRFREQARSYISSSVHRSNAP